MGHAGELGRGAHTWVRGCKEERQKALQIGMA